VTRPVAISIVLAAVLTTAGCQRPTAAPPGDQAGQEHPDWTLAQRRAFRAALWSAQGKLYERLRQVRVGKTDRLDRLIREGVLSTDEVRDLAASARIDRIAWLSDGRCRVEVSLGWPRIVQAVRWWDNAGRWAPHRQIPELNDSALLSAVSESEQG